MKVKLAFLSLICSMVYFSLLPLSGSSFEAYKKEKMIEDLAVIKHHLDIGYAPAEWKKECLGWTLEGAFEKSKQEIYNTPQITVKQFQKIVKRFLESLDDFHVGVRFVSTEQAALPFSVKSVDNRYFVDWIDPIRLPPSHYPIRLGDELIEFDGESVDVAVKALMSSVEGCGNSLTRQRFAEMALTHRRAAAGDSVPNQSVVIKTISRESKLSQYQIRWQYTPEKIFNPLDFMESVDFISDLFDRKSRPLLEKTLRIRMFNPLFVELMDRTDGSNYLGSKKGFVPFLGKILWQPKEKDTLQYLLRLLLEPSSDKFSSREEGQELAFESSDFSNEIDDAEPTFDPKIFHTYIYEHPSGAKVGFLRIPIYTEEMEEHLDDLAELIQYFDARTDALVIDQQNNPGGYAHVLYAVASMLTKEPLITPLHRMKLTNNIISKAFEAVDLISELESTLDFIDIGTMERPRINFQELLFLKAYYEFIIAEWNTGRMLTNPIHLGNVDYINPHPTARYTKPILFLINELDFSCADFMPAILQDSKRVVLFGRRTAGAGGVVEKITFPNINGIKQFTCTTTIADRGDKKIENMGIEPDIEYKLTVEDLQNGYQIYKKAINDAVGALISTTEQ